jgi:hypothetical protein
MLDTVPIGFYCCAEHFFRSYYIKEEINIDEILMAEFLIAIDCNQLFRLGILLQNKTYEYLPLRQLVQ